MPRQFAANLKKMINIAVGVMGVQFVSGLQAATMSSLFKFLGASNTSLSYLWLAAPLTGMIVQPIVGQLSDATASRFGKRIPYIFIWGILASITLCCMPFSHNLWMLFLLFWILDCSVNGCLETLRALSADITSSEQKTTVYALLAAASGIGAGIAAILPWLLSHQSAVILNEDVHNSIPFSIKGTFVIGSFLLVSCLMWAIFTVREKAFSKKQLLAKKRVNKTFYREIVHLYKKMIQNVRHMPKVIRDFYVIQLLTWIGIYSLWLYFGIAIAQHIFNLPVGAAVNTNPLYNKILEQGIAWAGICFGIYQFVSAIYTLFLPLLASKFDQKLIHGVSLLIGSLSILSAGLLHNPYFIAITMVGVGIMWGSVMTMPTAIVAKNLPRAKVGVYLGIFNVTVTLPQIISGLSLGVITGVIFRGNTIFTILLAGILIFIAGLLMLKQCHNGKIKKLKKGMEVQFSALP